MMPITFLNYDEAIEYISSIENSTTRSLVSFLLRRLELQGLVDVAPARDFDLLYFVKIAESALACHSIVRRILDGESLDWPVDQD